MEKATRRARWDELSRRAGMWLIGATLRTSPTAAWSLIGGALASCWIATPALGGTATVPPHYFYVPILFAGIRFGAKGSLGASLAAVVLSGPMSYAEVATGTRQAFADWGTRGAFFVVIGQVLTAIATMTSSAVAEELDDLRRTRRLWAALDQEQFQVHYQPIISMARGGQVVGAEALLRLSDPDRGLIGPDEFIPLAERTGMIRPIGAWAMRHACEQVVRWQQDGMVGQDFMLHVNVSARELDAPAFATRVSGILEDTGLPPACLHLEITETALADDPRRFIDALHDLRRAGLRLALDDFGTGHSTLAQVQRLPVELLKIDRTFVATLGTEANGAAIADNVLSLARALDLRIVAEGVEQAHQAAILRTLGCDLVQGFLYGRPVPAQDFEVALMGRTNPALRGSSVTRSG